MAGILTQEHTAVKTSSTGRARLVRTVVVVAVLALLVTIAGVTIVMRRSGTDKMAGAPTFTVTKGPLTISVTEAGTIRSRQQEVIKCEVEGVNTIIYLIPEGTRVKKGDLLCELDASKMQDQKVAQQILVQNAEAAFIRARETLEVTKSLGVSDTSKAELDALFAKEDLEKYTKGDFLNDVKTADSKIKVADEELKRAQDKLKWSEVLFAQKYLSQTELQADQLSVTRSELDLDLAKSAMELLKGFTYKRKLAELQSTVEQTKMALDRVKRKANADNVQAEATLRAAKSEFDRQQDVLEKTLRMIDKTKMIAPVDGLVVYATTGQGGFRGNQEPLQEGSTIRERQEIINLPTTSSVMAEVKVHESSLEKISLGLPVRVTIDALPGKMFTGRVAKIAPLPDAASVWMNPDMKVYNTEIYLDLGDDSLRTGMSCRAEIVVDRYPDAIYVPVQCIVRVAGKPTAYVATPNGPQPRVVQLGLDNNRMARILGGLSVGEKVLLNPPLSESHSEEESAELPAGFSATSRPSIPPAGPRAGLAPGRPGGRGERGDNGNGRMGAPDGADGANGPAAGGPGGGRRGNMTPEQREEMRKRFEAMTPEQREQMRRQMQERGGRGGRGAGPDAGDGPGTGGRGGRGGAAGAGRGGAAGGAAPGRQP